MRIVVIFLFFIYPIWTYAQSLDEEQRFISIGNGEISFAFDTNDGALIHFYNTTESVSFIAEDRIKKSLWQINFQTSSGIVSVDMFSASDFNTEKLDENNLKMTWHGFQANNYPDLKVVVIVRIEENSINSKWKIHLEGIESSPIERVIFPVISGLKDLEMENIAVADWMGSLLKEPRIHMKKNNINYLSWAYPGQLSMQLLTLYNSDKIGIYISCNDSLSFQKEFGVELDSKNNLSFHVVNFPEYSPAINEYTPDYETIISIFKGDWITATELYRKWAVEQKWTRESRLKTGKIPQWAKETALWVWNRGNIQNVLPPAEKLKKRLKLPVSVLYHWWHNGPYDDAFPEYFPPRDGEKVFKDNIAKASKSSVNTIIYMNQIQWGNATNSWNEEKAAEYAIKRIDGTTNSHLYNIFTGSTLTVMCMSTPFWRNKYATLAKQGINDYHVSGIYMDQACLGYLCYDPSHKHPVGGGNYWVKGSEILTNQIRSSTTTKDIVLSGEGVSESWLPYLDLFLTLQVSKERYAGVLGWETIPLFQAVYHPYSISYGSYSSLLSPPYDDLWPKEFAPDDALTLLDEKYNKQFLMEQARAFVWGIQPMIANYKDNLVEKRKTEIDFLIKIAKVRSKSLEYLLYGEFMRPPQINIPEENLTISRLSIYAGRGTERVTEQENMYPTLYHAAWRGEKRSVGIAIASILDYPYPIQIQFDSKDYGLEPSGYIFLIAEDGKKKIGKYEHGKIDIAMELSPRDAFVIELRSNKKIE